MSVQVWLMMVKSSVSLLTYLFCPHALTMIEKVGEISIYNCGFVYFSLQFYHFWPHLFEELLLDIHTFKMIPS